jgi:hypothetical protein
VVWGGNPGGEPGEEVHAVAVHSPCQYVGARAGLRPADVALCGRLDCVRASASGHLSGCRATAATASGCRSGARPPARSRAGPDAPNRQRLCRKRPARRRPGRGREGIDPSSPNPLRGLRWYVDPVEPAYRSYRTFVHKGRRHSASLMWRIAREPRFRWFGRWNSPVGPRVRDYLHCVAAAQPGAVPLMAVMRHQGKGCGATPVEAPPRMPAPVPGIASSRRPSGAPA